MDFSNKLTTLEFLRQLYPSNLPGRLVVGDMNKTGQTIRQNHFAFTELKAASRFIDKPLKDGWIKFNPIDIETALVRNQSAVGNSKEVTAAIGIALDVDIAVKDIKYPLRDTVLAAIESMPILPNILSNSNGHDNGLHCFWLFDSPLIIESQDQRDSIQALCTRWFLELKSKIKELVSLTGSDEGTHLDNTSNIDRLFRCPGSLRKSGNKVQAYLVNEQRAKLSCFRLPPLPQPEISKSRSTSKSSNGELKPVDEYLQEMDQGIEDILRSQGYTPQKEGEIGEDSIWSRPCETASPRTCKIKTSRYGVQGATVYSLNAQPLEGFDKAKGRVGNWYSPAMAFISFHSDVDAKDNEAAQKQCAAWCKRQLKLLRLKELAELEIDENHFDDDEVDENQTDEKCDTPANQETDKPLIRKSMAKTRKFANLDKPEVTLSLDEGQNVLEVVNCLSELGWTYRNMQQDLRIFRQGSKLVQVLQTKAHETIAGVEVAKGSYIIRSLPKSVLRARITEAVTLLRKTSQKKKEEETLNAVSPPRALVDAIHDWGTYPNVKNLVGVVSSPTLRPNGTIFQTPGYDEDTGLLFVSADVRFSQIPETPTQQQAAHAAKRLLEVVKDFPMRPADRSAWLAMVLTLIGRHCVPDCVPVFAINANSAGVGKSKLCDAASIIAFGSIVARQPYSQSDEELRKVITSALLMGLPYLLFDNVDCPFGSRSLDALVTGRTWSDRLLGGNDMTELFSRVVLSTTGNNLALKGDMVRRVLTINLRTELESPEDRSDFEQADLLSWVELNRARLSVDALTILRGYFAVGQPDQHLSAFGSFEKWSNLIRSSIVWAGQPDPLSHRSEAKAIDERTEQLRLAIQAIDDLDPQGDGVSVSELGQRLLCSEALQELSASVCGNAFDAKRIGYLFRSLQQRRLNGRYLAAVRSSHNVNKWTVQPKSRISAKDDFMNVDLDSAVFGEGDGKDLL